MSDSDRLFNADEIAEAIARAKNGRSDLNKALDRTVREAMGPEVVYAITTADIQQYLDGQEPLNDEQQLRYDAAARRCIEKAEPFGETLEICLDLAYNDATRQEQAQAA